MIVDQIVKVLTQGRDQTPAQRSDALRDLMVEESNNNVVIDSLGSFFSFLPFTQSHELAYEGTMKVILQLADPQDVSANLAYKVDAGVKHAKNPEINISVNQSATNTDLLDAGRANRVRTQQPQYMDVNQ
jgi:sugar diacid utilization regulator